ncbi:MAG TPA: hypothetical protein VNY97_04645 [Candidatus Angelobacter sp.]|jgi:hypothetical protein|nr:hypothetical protein [Candidatus Angelobacter sp.]
MSTNNYQQSWQAYKRLRNFLSVLLVTLIPVLVLAGRFGMEQFGSQVPHLVMMGIWFALIFGIGIYLENWPCPRCGKTFHKKWWYRLGILSPRCVHCGLPKYSNG